MKINHPFKTPIHPDLEGFLLVCEKFENKIKAKEDAAKKVAEATDKPEIMPSQEPANKK